MCLHMKAVDFGTSVPYSTNKLIVDENYIIFRTKMVFVHKLA